VCVCIHVYMYICTHIYIYIYIGVEAVERLALALEKSSNITEGDIARVMMTGVHDSIREDMNNSVWFQDAAKGGFELPTIDHAKHAVSLTMSGRDLDALDVPRTMSLASAADRPSSFHTELSSKI